LTKRTAHTAVPNLKTDHATSMANNGNNAAQNTRA